MKEEDMILAGSAVGFAFLAVLLLINAVVAPSLLLKIFDGFSAGVLSIVTYGQWKEWRQ